MSSIPYAPVTCVDTASSVGAADATIIGLDFRWAGEVNAQVVFVGTLGSIGTGDSVGIQVSPNWKADSPTNNTNAMWVTVETFTSTAFSGALIGPWTAMRVIKPGAQTAKVVAVAAGKQYKRADIQGT